MGRRLGMTMPTSSVRAYWCWHKALMLCVPCWERSGQPGQVQYESDLEIGDRCAECGAPLRVDI